MKKQLITLLLSIVLISGCLPLPVAVPQAASEEGKPVVATFAVNPAIVPEGQNTVLSWVVTGAETVSIDNGIGAVPLSGERSITPYATSTYNLTAQNSTGISMATVMVTVVGGLQPQTGDENIAVLSIVLDESGSLTKSGANYTRSSAVCAGDNPANQAARAFLSFDLTTLPPTAVISQAVLDLTGYAVVGNPTYSSANWGNMGALEIYQYQYGSMGSLGRLAYESTAPAVGSVKLMSAQSTESFLVDVTLDSRGGNVIQKLLSSAQGRCQFRLGFFTSTNWDNIADMICLERAVLRIKYRVP
ncbi:MAG: hypothetical protein JW901_01355 [Dehalococcoidia bacterium]|nr:hypothetical protein [Dehalococcoidia bacterium]